MTSLLRNFLNFFTSHTTDQREVIDSGGSPLNPLRVSHMPTSNASMGGLLVDYDVKICCLACIGAYKAPNQRKDLDWQFKYNRRLSDEHHAVYQTSGGLNNAVVIAIRGTSTFDDLITDVKITTSIFSGGEKDDPNILVESSKVRALALQLANAGYDMDNIYLTGHSLGALMAVYAHYSLPSTDCIIFNIGIPAGAKLPREKGLSLPRQINKMFEAPNIASYVMNNDPIALPSLNLFKNEIVVHPSQPASNAKQAHSITFMNSQLRTYQPISFVSPFAEFERTRNLRF